MVYISFYFYFIDLTVRPMFAGVLMRGGLNGRDTCSRHKRRGTRLKAVLWEGPGGGRPLPVSGGPGRGYYPRKNFRNWNVRRRILRIKGRKIDIMKAVSEQCEGVWQQFDIVLDVHWHCRLTLTQHVMLCHHYEIRVLFGHYGVFRPPRPPLTTGLNILSKQ